MVVGDVELVPVLDAAGPFVELAVAYPDVPAEEWSPYRELYPENFAGTRWRLPCAGYLLRRGGRTILVDTGVGPPGYWDLWTPESAGLLPAALEGLGVGRDDVDVVFLTHLHGDHIGWNTDEGGSVFFPRARYVVHEDALALARSHSERRHLRRCIEPLADRFELLDGDAELAQGVTAFVAPGHYPGHMGLRIRSGRRDAVLIADLAPHPALLDRTEWVYAFDDSSPTPTRAALVEELVDTNALVVCGHYPGSGIGRVARRDGRVVWEEAR